MRRHEEAQLLTLSPWCTEAQLLTSPHCRLRHFSNHNNQAKTSLDIEFYLNICLRTLLDMEVMGHTPTPKQTSRRQVAQTAEDLEHR